MAIKYSKSVAWVEPLVNHLADIVPIDRISSIKGFRVPKYLKRRTGGMISKYTGSKMFYITMCLSYYKAERTTDNNFVHNKFDRVDLGEFLTDFAHELAHACEWEHTMDHLALEAKILQRLCKYVKRHGIEIKDYTTFKKFDTLIPKKEG